MALPWSFAFRSIGVMENWSIGKRKSGCEGFQEPSLNNNALTIKRALLPSLHHSITPSPHKPLKFQESKSPLGITKAWFYGPGFLLLSYRF